MDKGIRASKGLMGFLRLQVEGLKLKGLQGFQGLYGLRRRLVLIRSGEFLQPRFLHLVAWDLHLACASLGLSTHLNAALYPDCPPSGNQISRLDGTSDGCAGPRK